MQQIPCEWKFNPIFTSGELCSGHLWVSGRRNGHVHRWSFRRMGIPGLWLVSVGIPQNFPAFWSEFQSLSPGQHGITFLSSSPNAHSDRFPSQLSIELWILDHRPLSCILAILVTAYDNDVYTFCLREAWVEFIDFYSRAWSLSWVHITDYLSMDHHL